MLKLGFGSHPQPIRQQTLKALPSEIFQFPYFFHLHCILSFSSGTPSKAFILQPKSTCLHIVLLPCLKSFNNKCAYSGPQASHFPTFLVKKIKSFLVYICCDSVGKESLPCGRPGFDPWVGKIPWRRERLPTPVFWPGEFHGLYSPWGLKELDTIKQLSLSQHQINCH